MILSWESLHRFGNTWNTTYPCLWTQFTCIHKCRWKLYHEKNPYASIIQKHCHPLCGKAQLNWTEAKWKTALWSDELNSEILFGKHGWHVLQTKEVKDPLSQTESLMVQGCLSVYKIGSLHMRKSTINAERCIQVLEQYMLPSRWHLFHGRLPIFQWNNAKSHNPWFLH